MKFFIMRGKIYNTRKFFYNAKKFLEWRYGGRPKIFIIRNKVYNAKENFEVQVRGEPKIFFILNAKKLLGCEYGGSQKQIL